MPRRVVIVTPSGASSAPPVAGWLATGGVEVTEVGTADWAAVVAACPDLVLLEHRPPALDALGAMRAWHADPAARAVPVVIFGGPEASAGAVEGLDLGAVDLLPAGLDACEFDARLRSALRLRNRIDSLQRLASHDTLTGLPNRSALEARIEAEWGLCRQDDQPVSLMVVDIDRFKRVNDECGHAVGDEVLRRVSKAIAGSLRGGDFIARSGGEEFVVVAPACDADCGELVAERVRRSVERVDTADLPGVGRVAVSIGLATALRPSACDPVDTLDQADEALYAAKAAGRNVVRSLSDLVRGADARHALIA